jgi:hypothetical protein
MMIEAYKCYDGQVLGLDKPGERSGENEGKIGNIQSHQKPTTKMLMLLSQTPLGTD